MARHPKHPGIDRACFKFSGKPKAAFATREDAENAIGDNRVLIVRECAAHGFHVGHKTADDPFERYD